jgi:hypothetical protein
MKPFFCENCPALPLNPIISAVVAVPTSRTEKPTANEATLHVDARSAGHLLLPLPPSAIQKDAHD